MQGWNQKLDSFWHVERRYDNTKPMVSKHHKLEDNLRPAGRKRSRKWEHIRKLSDTCYALCDGGEGDPIFDTNGSVDIPNQDTYNLSPIVWEVQPQPDGSYLETVKVRNGTGDYGHNSRYSFLHDFLPKGLKFRVDNGKQYVIANDSFSRQKYYLPKSKSMGASTEALRMQYRWRDNDEYVREDDQKFLTFARTAQIYTPSGRPSSVPDSRYPYPITNITFSDWVLISPEFKVVHPKQRVNKERKKELKPHLEKFWQWACAVGTMVPIDDWEYIREIKSALREGNVIEGWAYSSNTTYNGDEVQRILTTDDHPLRLPLLAMFMLRSGMKHATTPEDAWKVRAQFNTWANRACGLITTTKGE